MDLTYGWDPKMVIYFIWFSSLFIKVDDNMYSQGRHHDIS